MSLLDPKHPRFLWFLSLAAAVALITGYGVAEAVQTGNRPWSAWFLATHARPSFVVAVAVDAGIPTDTSQAFEPARDGGALDGGVTFLGMERVCLQSANAFYYEVGSLSSMTAYGARATTVPANTKECFFLRGNDSKIALGVTSGSALIIVTETYP